MIKNFTPTEFLQNKNVFDDNCLIIIDSNTLIIPPLSVIKQNTNLIIEYDYSKIDMSIYENIIEFYLANHIVAKLPNNLYILLNLNYIKVEYGISTNINEEINKLQKIKNLIELDITLSLFEDIDFQYFTEKLKGVKVIY